MSSKHKLMFLLPDLGPSRKIGAKSFQLLAFSDRVRAVRHFRIENASLDREAVDGGTRETGESIERSE